MKKALVLAVAGLLLSACSYQSGAPVSTTTPGTAQTGSPTGAVMTKTVLLSAQNNSEESGTAVLEEEAGKVKVTLALTGGGASLDVAQPAHIHIGVCPTPGAVKYPLTNVVRGESVTVLDLTLAELLAMGDLAINVHKSATQADFYVSCGNLK